MAGVTDFLIEHASKDPVSFHMPGHKGKALYQKCGYGEFLERFIDCDITEIIGADNLFQTEGIIAETMGKYRELYDAKASYLLVNGTSGGIIASILACAGKSSDGSDGGKLIMARNCHKSVFNAMTLGGIQPVYAYPSVVEEYGIAGPVEAEEISRLLDENPEAGAVILPSPNYYGICSDVEAISEEVHRRGKVLIIDQAHGAHLKFFEGRKGSTAMPKSAESCGADIVINSTHKTLASLTQSAVLNVMSDRVDLRVLEDKLQAIESTSPSYILMASLDINADIIKKHGCELMEKWQENLEYFYRKADRIEGLKIMKNSGLDFTKINLDMSACGLDGGQLEQELLKYEIYGELVTGNILMCMSGIGNTQKDFDRLLGALAEIAEKKSLISDEVNQPEAQTTAQETGSFLWTKKRTMHNMPEHKKLVKIEDAEGCFCAASIIPYPPGIPLICPGEEIGREEIEYVKELRARGEKVMGIDGEDRIVVGA
ncbi:MAG: hypothetical protein MJ144_02470 [Clostridia bacterium]|nr:hypothetical protein [Clostridia bacterium]